MTTLSSGQTLSGGTVTSSVTVLSGASIADATIAGGGYVFVSAGGVARSDVIAGGYLFASSGGLASGTNLVSGFLIVSGGSAVATTVSGGSLEVASGGVATGTTVGSAGDFSVGVGATASGTVFNGSFYSVEGTDSGTTFNGGFYTVGSGGTAVATTVEGGFFEIASGGQAISSVIEPRAIPIVSSGGALISATLLPGATVNLAGVPFVSGEALSFNGTTDTLVVTGGGATLATLQLAGSYAGDSFSVSQEPGGPTHGSTVISVTSNAAASGSSPATTSSAATASSAATTNTVSVGNGGSVTVTTPGTPFAVSNNGPGGTATISVGAGGAIVSGGQGSAVLSTPGLITLVPLPGGIVVPLATGSPLQASLLQSILTLGQTTTSQTVYLPNQTSIISSMLLSTQVLLDLPERTDTISGTAAVPVADIVLANPGVTYVTGGTAASIVVATDGAPARVINNSAGDALIAATGAANNTLEGLAGANQFITGSGGHDAVLLDGAANALTTNGADAVLVGGASTVSAAASGLDLVVMTAPTTLTFVDQSAGPSADTITGAAGGTAVFAGAGNAVINAAAGAEAFIVDTSAGNVTLNGAVSGGDVFTFVKDANSGSASVVVNNFTGSDVLAVHGYAAFNAAATTGGTVLSLSDGSSVTFTGVSVAAIQQAVKVV